MTSRPLCAGLQLLGESTAFREAHWGMALLGADFTIVRVNDSLARMLGYAPAQMSDMPPDRFTHAEDRARTLGYLESVRRGETAAAALRKRCICADGSSRWAELYAGPVRDARGEAEGYLVQVLDVTERVHAAELLQRERRLFMAGPVVVFRWIHAPGWPVEYVSPNVTAQFGWTPEELRSGAVPYASIVHPDDLARLSAEQNDNLVSCRTAFEREYRLLGRDGTVRHVRDFTLIHRAESGEVTHLEGYVFDDSKRHLAESDVRRQADDLRQLLRASRRLFEVETLDGMMEAVREVLHERLRVDHAWMYLLTPEHPGIVRLMAGAGPKTELKRRIAAEVRISDAPLLAEVLASEVPVFCGDARTDPRVARELVLAFDTRSLLAAPMFRERAVVGMLWTGTFGAEGEMRLSPPDADFFQHVAGLVALAYRRIHSETERQGALDRLRRAEKLEAVGQLAGGVAHNFNNSLTVILGHASLVLEDLPPDSPLRESVEAMLRAGKSGAKTVQQLLRFAQPVAQDSRERVDVGRSLEDFEKMLRAVLEEDIRLEVRAAPSLPVIELESGAFEMILMNLSLNARDAMRGGGILRIRAGVMEIADGEQLARGLSQSGRHLRLEVEDTGGGMDEATRARVFEPFFTTKGAGGTGLGLPAVYGAVKRAGGAIEVTSRASAGCRFSLLLPAAAGTCAAPPDARPRAEGMRRRILIAEDQAAVREFTSRSLLNRGFLVEAVADGSQALARLQDRAAHFDLLLTDVVMPGLDGGRLALRAAELRPALRILLMSGHPGWETGAPAALLRLPRLGKPFTAEELAQRVTEVLAPETAAV